MPTTVTDVAYFRSDRAWGARDLMEIEGVNMLRLHWTDKAYEWHVNDGPEAFVVLAGKVDMHYREGEAERVVCLGPSDIFLVHCGEMHRAVPRGEARILVVERKGSP